MAPRLKKTKSEEGSLATETASTNGSSSLPNTNTYFGESAPKRKGKAPSQKTQLVRAGLVKFPDHSPKELAEELNKMHPGFDFKNNDVSQQKLQLKNQSEKKKPAKTATRKAAATAPTTATQTTPYIVQLADLAKKVGTNKIREVCDIIDHLAK